MTRRTDRSTTLMLRYAARFALAAVLAAAGARECAASTAQAAAHTLRYALSCSLDERNASIEGTADVWVRILRDSLGSIAFRLPTSSTINSVTDHADGRIRRRVERGAAGGAPILVCTLPEGVGINDSLFFRIRYSATFDTSSASDIFINEREFLLQSTPHSTWVPVLDVPATAAPTARSAPVVIEMLAAEPFTVISGGSVDSLGTRDDATRWKITRTDVPGWEDSFCIAGSTIVESRTIAERPGVCGITLSTPTQAFDSSFARAILEMTGRASAYFASQRWRPRFGHIRFASVGSASAGSEPIVSGSLVVVRTGPEHAVFDSTVLSSSAHNSWLLETARAYAFDVPDSSYWFNESWAGYSATRFLFSTADSNLSLEMQERSHILSHALDFFPAQPVALGRTGGGNESAVFTYKGRYIFMMLEYVMGREAFDSAIRSLYDAARRQSPSIRQFQKLCETAYGSTLSWFFDQWLYRTGSPEYVLTSNVQPTQRGNFEAAVTLTQRGDVFVMPLTVLFETAGRTFLKRIFVSQQEQRFSFILPSAPVKIELNPRYLVLRWVPQFRILAHARASTSFRVFVRDLVRSEKEAQLTLQLDPGNTIGANALALFSLGKAAGARREWEKADQYFLAASQLHASGELSFYPLLSAVRRANILDLEGKREEALAEYSKALQAAEHDPLRYSKVIIEARRSIAKPFREHDTVWFEEY